LLFQHGMVLRTIKLFPFFGAFPAWNQQHQSKHKWLEWRFVFPLLINFQSILSFFLLPFAMSILWILISKIYIIILCLIFCAYACLQGDVLEEDIVIVVVAVSALQINRIAIDLNQNNQKQSLNLNYLNPPTNCQSESTILLLLASRLLSRSHPRLKGRT